MGETFFKREAGKAFAFLESEYGFGAPSGSASGIDESVTYMNRTTGVVLINERSHPGLFARFARLQHGRIPESPLYISETGEIHLFYLEDLLDLKAPEDASKLNSNAGMKRWLEAAAVLTRKHASRILKGDFGDFPALAKLVRERAQSMDESHHPRYYRLRKSMGHWKLGDR